MRETSCLPSVAVLSEREVVPLINTRENILEMVQKSPLLSTRRIVSCICVSPMQVWRTLHEEDLYPYHDQRVIWNQGTLLDSSNRTRLPGLGLSNSLWYFFRKAPLT